MTEALAQTVLQMGMTNYQPLCSYAVTWLRVTHFISYAFFGYALYTVVTHVSYANSVTRFIRRPLRSIRGAVLGRCGPMW